MRKIKDRSLLCAPGENKKESAWKDEKSVDFGKRKRCCLFDNPDGTKDTFFLYLPDTGTVAGREDRIDKICQCTRCGACVRYSHEEIHIYQPGFHWEDLDIYDSFTPVYMERREDGGITYVPAGNRVTFFDHYYDRD